jgi:hypothetical protein
VRVDGAPAPIYDFTASPEFGAVYVRVAPILHGFPAGASRLAEVLESWRWSRPR